MTHPPLSQEAARQALEALRSLLSRCSVSNDGRAEAEIAIASLSAALADKEAASPPGAPAPGWRLVPEEPTPEMLAAGMEHSLRLDEDKDRHRAMGEVICVWKDMLAASPTVPAPKEMPND